MHEDPKCQCHECGRCYHDHGGLKHKWTDPRPCPGLWRARYPDPRAWCSLQLNHPGECLFDAFDTEWTPNA